MRDSLSRLTTGQDGLNQQTYAGCRLFVAVMDKLDQVAADAGAGSGNDSRYWSSFIGAGLLCLILQLYSRSMSSSSSSGSSSVNSLDKISSTVTSSRFYSFQINYLTGYFKFEYVFSPLFIIIIIINHIIHSLPTGNVF